MNKISVKICTGTMCHIMGGSDLLLLREHLSTEILDCVTISGVTCLNYCKEEEKGKPPFVLIDAQIIPQATIPKVVEILTRLVGE